MSSHSASCLVTACARTSSPRIPLREQTDGANLSHWQPRFRLETSLLNPLEAPPVGRRELLLAAASACDHPRPLRYRQRTQATCGGIRRLVTFASVGFDMPAAAPGYRRSSRGPSRGTMPSASLQGRVYGVSEGGRSDTPTMRLPAVEPEMKTAAEAAVSMSTAYRAYPRSLRIFSIAAMTASRSEALSPVRNVSVTLPFGLRITCTRPAAPMLYSLRSTS